MPLPVAIHGSGKVERLEQAVTALASPTPGRTDVSSLRSPGTGADGLLDDDRALVGYGKLPCERLFAGKGSSQHPLVQPYRPWPENCRAIRPDPKFALVRRLRA